MRAPTGDDSEREVAKRGRCRGRGGKSWLGYILERTTISRSKKLWLLVLSGAHAGVSARRGRRLPDFDAFILAAGSSAVLGVQHATTRAATPILPKRFAETCLP